MSGVLRMTSSSRRGSCAPNLDAGLTAGAVESAGASVGTLVILVTEVPGEGPGGPFVPTLGPVFAFSAGLTSGAPAVSSRCLRSRAMTFES